MKKNIIYSVLLVFALPLVAYAQRPFSDKGIIYTVSPLFGYETVYRSTPTPHTTAKVMYGIRLTAGYEKISAELEFTRSNDTENYINAPQKISYLDEKLKLGVRSSYGISSLFSISVRLGGQAKQSTVESTSNNVTTTTKNDPEYSPYAGGAFNAYLGKIGFHLGTTVVFKDFNDMGKNEYQNTIAVSTGF